MSKILDQLKAQREDIREQWTELDEVLTDLERAIDAIESARGTTKGKSGPQLSVADAIVEAVKNDAGSLDEILRFLSRQFAIHTTKNTVSSYLSRLRAAGKVDHDGQKWVMPKAHSASEETPQEAEMVADETSGSHPDILSIESRNTTGVLG